MVNRPFVNVAYKLRLLVFWWFIAWIFTAFLTLRSQLHWLMTGDALCCFSEWIARRSCWMVLWIFFSNNNTRFTCSLQGLKKTQGMRNTRVKFAKSIPNKAWEPLKVKFLHSNCDFCEVNMCLCFTKESLQGCVVYFWPLLGYHDGGGDVDCAPVRADYGRRHFDTNKKTKVVNQHCPVENKAVKHPAFW